MDPTAIAAALREIAAHYERHREPHRARAYARSATVVESTPDLVRRVADGTLTEIAGIGASTSKAITELYELGHTEVLDNVRLARGGQLLQETAHALTERIATFLRGVPAVREVVACGPARRWIEMTDTVGLAVCTTEPGEVLDRLRSYPIVLAVERPASDRAIARLAGGAICDVALAPPARFGIAQLVATGAPAHLDALRARGLDAIDAPDEAAAYRALKLPYIPPELRDGTDELALADAGDDFTDLVTRADIRGAVHCHTVASDGRHTIDEMARAAAAAGLDYLTITDHSAAARYAGGLHADRLRAQALELAAARAASPVRLLHGTEADILKDGAIDVPDGMLADLDVVIASIHTRHKQDIDAMTARVVAALRAPHFKIWGHPLGRHMPDRGPVPLHLDAVLDAIAAAPCALEINGDPRRLDVPPDLARAALARGAKFVLSTDAHSTRQLTPFLDNAVGIARRARIRRRDVLNALPADAFAAAVRPTMRHGP